MVMKMNKEEFDKNNVFGLGQPNDVYAKFFIGNSYLNPLAKIEVPGVDTSNEWCEEVSDDEYNRI